VALGCDLPLVRVSTLQRVARAGMAVDRPAAVYGPCGWEPLVAYWPRAVYNQLRAALACRQLALHELLDRLGAVAVTGVERSELCNVNTPADLEKAAKATKKRSR
jgi:molybdopterin-guanine dinucleotide biosynthesis protein A